MLGLYQRCKGQRMSSAKDTEKAEEEFQNVLCRAGVREV